MNRRMFLALLAGASVPTVAGDSEYIRWSPTWVFEDSSNISPFGPLRLGGNQDWEGVDSFPSYYETPGSPEIVDTYAYSGSHSVRTYNERGTSFYWTPAFDRPPSFQFVYREGDGQSGGGVEFQNENGDWILRAGTTNPDPGVYGTQGQGFNVDPTPSYDEWRRMTIDFDWDNGTASTTWTDLTGDSGSDTVQSTLSGDGPISRVSFKAFENYFLLDGVHEAEFIDESWWDDIGGAVKPDGYALLEAREFGGDIRPTVSLDAEFRGGTVTVHIIASPGTPQEEVYTESNSKSFVPSFNGDHQIYQPRIQMETSDSSVSPTVESLEMSVESLGIGYSSHRLVTNEIVGTENGSVVVDSG